MTHAIARAPCSREAKRGAAAGERRAAQPRGLARCPTRRRAQRCAARPSAASAAPPGAGQAAAAAPDTWSTARGRDAVCLVSAHAAHTQTARSCAASRPRARCRALATRRQRRKAAQRTAQGAWRGTHDGGNARVCREVGGAPRGADGARQRQKLLRFFHVCHRALVRAFVSFSGVRFSVFARGGGAHGVHRASRAAQRARLLLPEATRSGETEWAAPPSRLCLVWVER